MNAALVFLTIAKGIFWLCAAMTVVGVGGALSNWLRSLARDESVGHE